MHKTTLTITVPPKLALNVRSHVASSESLEVIYDCTHYYGKNPTITVFVILGSLEEVDKASEHLNKMLYDYNNKPVEKKLTFWQKIMWWSVNRRDYTDSF